jgi:hypothetical protein
VGTSCLHEISNEACWTADPKVYTERTESPFWHRLPGRCHLRCNRFRGLSLVPPWTILSQVIWRATSKSCLRPVRVEATVRPVPSLLEICWICFFGSASSSTNLVKIPDNSVVVSRRNGLVLVLQDGTTVFTGTHDSGRANDGELTIADAIGGVANWAPQSARLAIS